MQDFTSKNARRKRRRIAQVAISRSRQADARRTENMVRISSMARCIDQ